MQLPLFWPVPISDYLAYGHWFQRKAVPDVDRRKVIEVKRDPESFSLSVQDGEPFRAKRVIVATGRPIRLASSAVLYTSPGRNHDGHAPTSTSSAS
jgi:thioredoxin reductase